MRRSAPVVVVAVGLCALLASYVWYSQNVVNSLQSEAAQTSAIYARVLRANTDTTREAANLAMLDLIDAIKKLRVPVVLTSVDGKFVTSVNIPDGADPLAYAATLDKQNSPFVQEGVGKVHFGNTPLINGMRVIPLLQVGVLIILIFAGVSVLLTRGRADRESVFAGMARESAHQLGTPLSSLHGWMELLREREDPMITQALPHMESDIERLERVAHRFERIGRHPKRDPIDVGAIATHVVTYFQARVPTLANAIALSTVVPEQPITLLGDRVLLEWAIESLVKNAIDALAGQGGKITVTVEPVSGSGARIRVADNGPGVPKALRRKIFAAGFSTKERGWGIGLALTRRIVEENHGGRLSLANAESGAVFDIVLRG
jgi:nitrogen-specific signal transduction histidine kinase